jgi:hypothetical protein
MAFTSCALMAERSAPVTVSAPALAPSRALRLLFPRWIVGERQRLLAGPALAHRTSRPNDAEQRLAARTDRHLGGCQLSHRRRCASACSRPSRPALGALSARPADGASLGKAPRRQPSTVRPGWLPPLERHGEERR